MLLIINYTHSALALSHNYSVLISQVSLVLSLSLPLVSFLQSLWFMSVMFSGATLRNKPSYQPPSSRVNVHLEKRCLQGRVCVREIISITPKNNTEFVSRKIGRDKAGILQFMVHYGGEGWKYLRSNPLKWTYYGWELVFWPPAYSLVFILAYSAQEQAT